MILVHCALPKYLSKGVRGAVRNHHKACFLCSVSFHTGHDKWLWKRVFDLTAKMPLTMPTFHIGVPGFKAHSGFILMHSLRSSR